MGAVPALVHINNLIHVKATRVKKRLRLWSPQWLSSFSEWLGTIFTSKTNSGIPYPSFEEY